MMVHEFHFAEIQALGIAFAGTRTVFIRRGIGLMRIVKMDPGEELVVLMTFEPGQKPARYRVRGISVLKEFMTLKLSRESSYSSKPCLSPNRPRST